jgi:Chaperone of endosialidase
MNTLIQLKRPTPFFLVAVLLACFGILDEAQAVITDPEDYFPNGNTGAGQGALLNINLDQGQFNTAIGLLSLSGITDGDFNTGVGAGTLLVNTGSNNTATGAAALLSNTIGADNTAIGTSALAANTNGGQNTATGAAALLSNTTGDNNTATGSEALLSNIIGEDNTATGTSALARNVEGNWNTAMGSQALASNIGYDNTAIGFRALSSNTDGSSNTAMGSNALLNNTSASFNVGIGRDTLGSNAAGNSNTAVGYGALFTNTTGSNNVALGAFSGKGVTTAFNVICIGNGVLGADVNNSTWIGNIWGVTPQSETTAPVVVSDGGQLGVVASSERFKKDIANMDKASEMILSLRPVTFHYKGDAKGTAQFGLIAEEVAKVNPALVLPDKDGKPYTVRYDAVNAMLLNEFLKEHRKVENLEAALRAVNARLAEQDAKIQKVSAQLEMSKPAPRTVLNNR